MNPLLGRAIAVVGVICGYLGIWLAGFDFDELGTVSYWDADGTYGVFLLILTTAAALLLAGAAITGLPVLDVALGAVGAALWGAFVFFPSAYVAAHAGVIGAGGWLGACTFLIPLGAALAYVAARRAPLDDRVTAAPEALLPAAVAFAGAAVVLAGLWFKVTEGDKEGYWSASGSRHAVGILFLVLLALSTGSLAGRRAPRPPRRAPRRGALRTGRPRARRGVPGDRALARARRPAPRRLAAALRRDPPRRRGAPRLAPDDPAPAPWTRARAGARCEARGRLSRPRTVARRSRPCSPRSG